MSGQGSWAVTDASLVFGRLALLVAFLSTAGYYDGVGVVTSVPEPPVLALQARPPPFFAADQQTAPLVPIVLARNQV